MSEGLKFDVPAESPEPGRIVLGTVTMKWIAVFALSAVAAMPVKAAPVTYATYHECMAAIADLAQSGINVTGMGCAQRGFGWTIFVAGKKPK